MSTRGVVSKPLVDNPRLLEWKDGSITSSKFLVKTIFKFMKVLHLSFLTFHFSSRCALPYL